ncbi:aspartyl protease family protein [Lewinella sp. JB7]|uniref:aspartyl protease family protein n=1 Tax=Lewinella sp. JB7 TaxID=2962887 RepID=UPI0020C9519D|nr:aspartyl protease family protein [Lewinella sp. JB7]MCP9237660.1 aspartyl protease family protein [Lewinella sp. JB7]
MLTHASPYRLFGACLIAAALLLWGSVASAQRSIGFLRAPALAAIDEKTADTDYTEEESFNLERNLIFFEATVDGRPGNFILDTGAPTLIVNHRGKTEEEGTRTGLGAGGDVTLTDHRVERFEMGGRTTANYWAIGLDLRDLEARMDQRVDGFVGYDLINTGELRIDYRTERFQLLKSTRRPEHLGKSPRAVLKFSLVDHLPVVWLRIGKKKYYFAVDTGAGSNLIDRDALPVEAYQATESIINIQGLDGNDTDCPTIEVAPPANLPSAGAESLRFVAMPLDHLRTEGGVHLAGILGSEFLSRYTVGIDYRRQKLYLW